MSNYIRQVFPITIWIKKYSKNKLIQDSFAGATLATIVIPQALSYAILANLPPIYGLYATISSSICQFLFGVSPFSSLGPFAVVSLMTGDAILSIAMEITPSRTNSTFMAYNTFSDEYPLLIPIAELLTLSVGLILLLVMATRAGKLFGFLLPSYLIGGFTGAASLSIITSQAKTLFGIKLPPITGSYVIIRTWIMIFDSISQFQILTFILGTATILIMLIIEYLENNSNVIKSYILQSAARFYRLESPTRQDSERETPKNSVKIPKMLIAISVITLISYLNHLNETHNLALVGQIASGFPAITNPTRIFQMISTETAKPLLFGIIINAGAIAMVTYVTLLSILQSFPIPEWDFLQEEVVELLPNTNSSPARVTATEQDGIDCLNTDTNTQAIETSTELLIIPDQVETPPPKESIISKLSKKIQSFSSPWENEDHELLAGAMACILCSCASGFVPSGSLSRSAILANQADSVSPMSSIISSIFIIITISFLTGLVYYIPLTCLAAVVIFSLQSTVIKIGQIKVIFNKLREKRGWKEWEEFSVWILTFLSVFIFDPSSGIMIGMIVSLFWKLFNAFHKSKPREPSNSGTPTATPLSLP